MDVAAAAGAAAVADDTDRWRHMRAHGLLAALLSLATLATLPMAAWWVLTQPFVIARPVAVPAADPRRLRAHVEHLSVELHPRSADHGDNLQKTSDYIARAFRADRGSAAAEFQTFEVDGRFYRNVVTRFGPPTGPLLVVGAHYDTHGETPGADDNASGVAGLLELSRLLTLKPPTRPVMLVAYVLEEPPHFARSSMGSVQHARSLQLAGQPVEMMLSLEMIGYFSDAEGSQRYPHAPMRYLYPARGNFIAVIGRPEDMWATRAVKARMTGATRLPVRSMNAPRTVKGLGWSDHRSYWDAGYTALMITDTAFLRNPHYHRIEDTAEKLDYGRMAQVVEAVTAVVHGD